MSDDEHFQRHHTNAFINNILQIKSDGDDKKAQKQAIPLPFFAQGFTDIYITQYTIKETKGNKIIPRHPNPPCFL